MAYANYFPATYQPNYYGQPNPYYPQNYQQNYPQMQQTMMQQAQVAQAQQQSQQMQQPSIQQSGFVLVQSEQEARAYPVAPGNSITFKDERQPYCYVKTMGFNQLDQPTFERYRLVKEDSLTEQMQPNKQADNSAKHKESTYATKTDLDALWGEIEALKEKLTYTNDKKNNKNRKVEQETEAVNNE